MQKNQTAPAVGHFEPSMGIQFLPGCACGHRHPLAERPPVDSETCLACGAPVAKPGAFQEVPAVLTGGGIVGAFGIGLLKIAAALAKFIEKHSKP